MASINIQVSCPAHYLRYNINLSKTPSFALISAAKACPFHKTISLVQVTFSNLGLEAHTLHIIPITDIENAATTKAISPVKKRLTTIPGSPSSKYKTFYETSRVFMTKPFVQNIDIEKETCDHKSQVSFLIRRAEPCRWQTDCRLPGRTFRGVLQR